MYQEYPLSKYYHDIKTDSEQKIAYLKSECSEYRAYAKNLKNQLLYYSDFLKKRFNIIATKEVFSMKTNNYDTQLYKDAKAILEFEENPMYRVLLNRIISYFNLLDKISKTTFEIKQYEKLIKMDYRKYMNVVHTYYNEAAKQIVKGGGYRFTKDTGTVVIVEKKLQSVELRKLIKHKELKENLKDDSQQTDILKDKGETNALLRWNVLSALKHLYQVDDKYYDIVLLNNGSGTPINYYIKKAKHGYVAINNQKENPTFNTNTIEGREDVMLILYDVASKIRYALTTNPALRVNFIRDGKRQYYKHREDYSQNR